MQALHHLRPVHFCCGYYGEGGLYLPGLTLNHDPPDLRLPSSSDYRCEPPVPDSSLPFDLSQVFATVTER
jgi:hypothetical protein